MNIFDFEGPKPGEKTGCMEFGGRGDNDGRSSRSEDELFSDAVTEFNEAGPTVGSGEHLEEAKLAENSDGKGPSRNLTMFYSFKDNALAGEFLKGVLDFFNVGFVY